jgi:hypothetical protein
MWKSKLMNAGVTIRIAFRVLCLVVATTLVAATALADSRYLPTA